MDSSNKTFSPQAASDIKEQAARADNQSELLDANDLWVLYTLKEYIESKLKNGEIYTLEGYIDNFFAEEVKRVSSETYAGCPKRK